MALSRPLTDGMPSSTRPLPHDEAMDLMSLALLSYSAAPLREAFKDKKPIVSVLSRPIDPALPKDEEMKRVSEEFAKLPQLDAPDDGYDDDRFPGVWSRVAALFKCLFVHDKDAAERAHAVWAHGKSTADYEAFWHLTARYPDLYVEELVETPFTAVCVSEKAKKVFVVFRGTVRKVDWLMDALKHLRNLKESVKHNEALEGIDPGVLVHHGFFTELAGRKEMYERVVELLAARGGYQVHACGHSLGGALTTLFSYLACHDKRLRDVLTPATPLVSLAAAAPRVGNLAFKRTFEALDRTFFVRLCNAGDVVTAVPAFGTHRLWPHLYHHVTQTPPLVISYKGALAYGWGSVKALLGYNAEGAPDRMAPVSKAAPGRLPSPLHMEGPPTQLDALSTWTQPRGAGWFDSAAMFSLFVGRSAAQHNAWKYMRKLDTVPAAYQHDLLDRSVPRQSLQGKSVWEDHRQEPSQAA